MAARVAALRAPDEPTPLGRVISYVLLGFWAFVVLFPLYWVIITSVKLPVAFTRKLPELEIVPANVVLVPLLAMKLPVFVTESSVAVPMLRTTPSACVVSVPPETTAPPVS